jgi:hypothetical protein
MDWTSSDRTVGGDLDIDDDFKYVAIWDWWSAQEGQGNTVRALKELRATYPGYRISVQAAMDEAIPYWQAVAQKGLVDAIFDVDNRKIYP